LCGAATVADAPDVDTVDNCGGTWDRTCARFLGEAGGGVSGDPAVNYTIAVSLQKGVMESASIRS
jgi:hypothetical protein